MLTFPRQTSTLIFMLDKILNTTIALPKAQTTQGIESLNFIAAESFKPINELQNHMTSLHYE